MIAVAEEAGQSFLVGLMRDRIAADGDITWAPDTGLDATHPSAATSPSSSFTAAPAGSPSLGTTSPSLPARTAHPPDRGRLACVHYFKWRAPAS
ncbi:hypothetical protein [Streptomyces sp. 6-11-2]|uniref:hypothetical protein n=1 Tax=Streptomyces sp. 6-11-2 TaxID=2585753 RepID=UPI0011443FF1|nr:hypothetical protein [Streptomyces sp. 6-11-2]GED88503.1 hypothetical protein TNCT6_55880 [Streptomyces sp. 6-11-2]